MLRSNPRILKQFKKNFIEDKFYQLNRIGKYLFFIGKHCSLILHFGMSGVINWYPPKNPLNAIKPNPRTKHEYLALYFKDGSILSFIDPRTFGKIILSLNGSDTKTTSFNNTNSTGIPVSVLTTFYEYAKIGIDILNTPLRELTSLCIKKFSISQRVLKNILLDQTVITGVGNIYADESLFKAGLSPLRKANTVRPDEWKHLLTCIKATFRSAIASGGSSISDYRKPNGLTGDFQSKFIVYSKGGENCPHCKIPFKQIIIQARTTTYCESCQQ